MLQVDEELKRLYQADSTDKNLIVEFRRLGQPEPFLRLWESGYIMSESMTIEESLSSSENLDFGSCEATQISLTLIDIEDNIKGSEMAVYQTLDGLYPDLGLYPGIDVYPSGYTMPLGKYIVQSADRQTNRKYRDLVALDYMCLFDVNVIDWYNALPFPLTLREIRSRLCRHIGVTEYVPDYLPNDGVMIYKTIEAAELMGRDVLIACEQLNGVFGHFDRNGVLQHITLQPNYCLMPAVDLYPGTDVYPVLPGEMNDQVYDERIDPYLCISCQFEEYTVQSIDKVQIRQEEGDIGAIYGTGSNCLTVEGNFLAFGKTAAELNQIAMGIYGMVNGRQYIPYECDLKGLPYMEVGDAELLDFGGESIVSYIVKRTLKGIYALKDTHSATGEEIRSTEHNVNTEIIQLKGKAAILKRNVEEVSAELFDFEKDTSAKFAITAEQISAEVKRAQEAEASLKIMADQITLSVKNLKEDTESQFLQTAEQISLKVSKGDVSSQLSLEPDQIKLTGNRVIIESDNLKVSANGRLRCTDGEFSGTLESAVFYAGDDMVQFGDFFVTADGSNVLQSQDGSVSIQTAAGGPFGRYTTIYLSSNSGDTELSDHHLDTPFVSTRLVEAENDVKIRNGWSRWWSCVDMFDELYDSISDSRLKNSINKLDTKEALEALVKIDPCIFKYNKPVNPHRTKNDWSIGVIAQEVLEPLKNYPIVTTGLDGFYRVDYTGFIPMLIAAIKELQNEILKLT